MDRFAFTPARRAPSRGLRFAVAGTFLTATLAAVGVLPSSSAQAQTVEDPFFLNWPEFLVSVPTDFTASTETDCPRGSVKCVDKVVRTMGKRLRKHACHHDSAFALLYLVTTEMYRVAVEDPHYFEDNAFVNHEDAVFADYYFDAADAWDRDDLANVPPAWRVAFHAADTGEVSAMGDALLGMNAHIRRDLPFVLNGIGLVKPDGTSRKPDHDRVNHILRAASAAAIGDGAACYDPTMDDGDIPGISLDNDAQLQIVMAWREEAWRKAELLANAPTEAHRIAIAAWIEADAAQSAVLIRDAYRTDAAANDSRDAYCQVHSDECRR